MINIKFRTTLELNDPERIREIVRSTGFFYDFETEVAAELAETALKDGQEKSGYFFLFAETGNVTAGYSCFGPIACTKGSFDLYWIAVHNDFRNKGAGKLLLYETHKLIEKMGGRLVIAETSGTEKYLPTRDFYLKNNYKPEAVIKDFYHPGDDKCLFVYRF